MAKTSIEKFFGNKYVQLGALIAGGLALVRTWKTKGAAGIGAVHYTIVGKVLDVWYKNTSYVGNNSYWVMLETDRGYVRAYTAANASLGYTIESMRGKTVGFDVTRRKDGGIVLNSTADGWDYYGNKKK